MAGNRPIEFRRAREKRRQQTTASRAERDSSLLSQPEGSTPPSLPAGRLRCAQGRSLKTWGKLTLLAAATAALVAACGPSQSTTTRPPAVAPGATTGTGVADAATTVAPTTARPGSLSGGTSTTVEGAACNPGQLAISLVRYQGAAGLGYYDFSVTNRGAASCQVGGYFGVAIYGTGGQELSSTVVRESTTLQGSGVQVVPLQPNGAANFTVSVVENGPNPCVPIGTFGFIPPNSSVGAVTVAPQRQGGYCGSPAIEPTQPGPVPG